MAFLGAILVGGFAGIVGLVVFAAAFIFIRQPPPGRNRYGTPSETRGPLGAVGNGFRGWFNFFGRSNRWDFLVFALFVAMLCLVPPALVIGAAWLNEKSWTWSLWSGWLYPALALPSLTMAVRRLHDGNRSGWWLLLLLCFGYFILLYWFLQPPQRDASADAF